jgi:hypothetical protein
VTPNIRCPVPDGTHIPDLQHKTSAGAHAQGDEQLRSDAPIGGRCLARAVESPSGTIEPACKPTPKKRSRARDSAPLRRLLVQASPTGGVTDHD